MWNTTNIPNLKGKVAVVTGGNAGIGLPTVEQLAIHGAKVFMASRSENKAMEAIKILRTKYPSVLSEDSIIWLPCDLASIAGSIQSAKELISKTDRLDIIVNNAGMAANGFETSVDGFEITFAINHVGHFAFTYHLLPLLKKTSHLPDADVRVITVSSGAESFSPTTIPFKSLEDFKNPCSSPSNYTSLFSLFKRYGLSKSANVLFTSELQRRFDIDNLDIISISLNPGGVATSGGLGVWPWFLRPFLWLILMAPEKGALTQLFAATATEVSKEREKYKGKFLGGVRSVKEPSERSRDMALAGRLWDLSEQVIGVA